MCIRDSSSTHQQSVVFGATAIGDTINTARDDVFTSIAVDLCTCVSASDFKSIVISTSQVASLPASNDDVVSAVISVCKIVGASCNFKKIITS